MNDVCRLVQLFVMPETNATSESSFSILVCQEHEL